MNEMIDISNYEAYVMDYLEGSLDAATYDAFRAFLILHPEIAEEIEELESFEPIQPSDQLFDKSSLKLSIAPTSHFNQDNYEEAFASSADQSLDPALAEELMAFVDQNPTLKRDFDLYLLTSLKSNPEVVFSAKSSLKQPIPLWDDIAWQPVVRIAASLLLLIGAYTIWNVVNEVQYTPRNEAFDITYESVEETNPLINKQMNSSSKLMATVADPIATDGNKNGRNHRSTVSNMPRRELKLEKKEVEIPDAPTLLAYVPEIRAWEEDRHVKQQSGGSTLNMAQFVGKQFLGLNPDHTPTAKALLKESVIKAIDQSESIAVDTEDDERSTFEFLAGNFEFKRVNYK